MGDGRGGGGRPWRWEAVVTAWGGGREVWMAGTSPAMTVSGAAMMVRGPAMTVSGLSVVGMLEGMTYGGGI